MIALVILGGGTFVILSILRDGKERNWVANMDLHGYYFLLPQDKAEAMRDLRVSDLEDVEEYVLDEATECITFLKFTGRYTYRLSFITLGKQTVLNARSCRRLKGGRGVKVNRFFIKKLHAAPIDAALFHRLRQLPLAPDATPFSPPYGGGGQASDADRSAKH